MLERHEHYRNEQQMINIIDMVSWLRDKFSEDGYEIQESIMEEPGLPIHLYCNKIEGIKERLVIIVSSAVEIKENYFEKLCFLQSYLFRHFDPVELKLILVVPENAEINRLEDYEKRGFGLLKITPPTETEVIKFDYIYEPSTFRDRMIKDFREEFGKMEKESKFARFFNQYIDDAVFGITDKNLVKFEERNIDRKLLELTSKLENVSYANDLKKIANAYLNYEIDDYSFALKWIKILWESNFSKTYPDIHERFEPLLKELYPKYRDHFCHQFQVFLLGTIIVDYLIELGTFDGDKEILSKGWLLTATYHDFAQAVQRYDDWNKTFFKESLNIKILESLELKKYYVEHTFSSSIEHIISALGGCFCDLDEQNPTDDYNKIRHFFYHQITENKNHALLSSLSLLKLFGNNGEFHTIVLPSASAIAIHDDDIWQALNGTLDNTNKNDCCENICTLKPLPRLKLEIHPLSFLLILCDSIQDWGRHFKDLKLEESLNSANVGLKNIFLNDHTITIQIFLNHDKASLDYFNHIVKSLNSVKNLLQASSPKFLVEFWDRVKNEKLDFDVEIND